jgi:hypothetical protein
MAIFAGGNGAKPDWLPETQEFCRSSGIKVMGWGPNLLTVEAKTPQSAKEIASHLAQFGFKVVENEDNAYAGMLDLSKNPEALRAKIASFDISRRRWDEQIVPILCAVCAIGLLVSGFSGGDDRNSPWVTLPLGTLAAAAFFWYAPRVWGWRLQLLPEALRVRRLYRWTVIPWNQISAIESVSSGGRQESVVVKLGSRHSEQLGTFNDAFARNLRDRLRYELSQRQH